MANDPTTKPGAELPFVEELRKKGMWPLPKAPVKSYRGIPMATPFLVIPISNEDQGARPIAPGGPKGQMPDNVMHNPSIEIVGAQGPVPKAEPGKSYQLRCKVKNLGSMPCYSGLAEFYVRPPGYSTGRPVKPGAPQGLAGFSVMLGETVTVVSPNLWKPANAAEAARDIFVQAYDFLLDPVRQPLNQIADRHVGLRQGPRASGTGGFSGQGSNPH